MLPFRETAKLVGAKASLEPDGKYLIISYSADTLAYEIGHHGYKVNGHRQFMRATSEMHKNHLFVPIRLFNDITAGRVHAELH